MVKVQNDEINLCMPTIDPMYLFSLILVLEKLTRAMLNLYNLKTKKHHLAVHKCILMEFFSGVIGNFKSDPAKNIPRVYSYAKLVCGNGTFEKKYLNSEI